MKFTPYDRPVRAAFVGLGRIYDLNMLAYVDNPDVEVVALVDPSEERRA
jgi:predicted dehydrogenase